MHRGEHLRLVDAGTADDCQPRPELRGTQPDLPSGHETVLLVDDEAHLRRVVTIWLRTFGYRVLHVASADEALRVMDSERIDLLLSDVIMPEMDGPMLATLARRRDPRVRVLFMSAYFDASSPRIGSFFDSPPLLPKPFEVGSLMRKVREILDKPA